VTEQTIAYYAREFFPHLLPEYGRAAIIAILNNRRKDK